jgi:hypothetical protein
MSSKAAGYSPAIGPVCKKKKPPESSGFSCFSSVKGSRG